MSWLYIRFFQILFNQRSKSAYDAWSERCFVLAYAQTFLAASYLLALLMKDLSKQEVKDPVPPIRMSEKIADIAPVLLPLFSLLSRPTDVLKPFLVYRQHRANPLVFGAYQAVHLLVCTAISVYFGITSENSALFWISLVLHSFPAVIVFGHAIFGLHMCYARKDPFIEQASLDEFESYTDSVEEDDGPLGRFYRSQKEEGRIRNEDVSSRALESTPSSSRGGKSVPPGVPRSTLDSSSLPIVINDALPGPSSETQDLSDSNSEPNAIFMHNLSNHLTTTSQLRGSVSHPTTWGQVSDGQQQKDHLPGPRPAAEDSPERPLQTTTDEPLMRRSKRFWYGPATQETSHPYVRVRWQEDLKNKRDGGMIFWIPFLVSMSLSVTTCNRGSGAIRYAKYLDENLVRQIMLISFVPGLLSFVPLVTVTLALYRPRFSLILLSLCTSIATTAMWATIFVIGVREFHTQLPFGMPIIALPMTATHSSFLYISMKLEWDPDYQSFMQKLGWGR